MKKFYLLLAFAGLITSCKTNQLYLSVVEPAPVTIPADIKKVGVINRSAATEETKAIDVADKILSLEGANLDKEGSQESIKGLSEELLNNNRFTDVIPLNDIDFRTPKLGVFPTPLSWDIVDQICKSTGIDALFSLEKFDTDTRVSYSTRKVDIKTPLGTVPGLEHTASMETLVKTGWRIYDPASRAILDEFLYDESIVSSGRGVNPLAAAAALMGRKEAVKQVGNKAGHGYAMRIIPFELRVMRDYYVKGSDRFKVAKRKAQMGKWDEAGELWKAELQNPKMKIASRATYNMAIISEINGDLEGALKWAQKSYEDYNNKLGREYVRILENRRYKNQVLAEQEKR
jgi:hypothetical protein